MFARARGWVWVLNARRVAICNYRGTILLDCYVLPTMSVTDYRTSTTGITPADLSSGKGTENIVLLLWALTRPPNTCLRQADAKPFDEVQRSVASIIRDKVLIGHSLWNDLSGEYCNRAIMFQDVCHNRPLTVASFYFYHFFLVLGIPHPAVNTRDVALYQPFRNALRLPNQPVRLPTLTFHLMGRRCQEGQQNPVRPTIFLKFEKGTSLLLATCDPFAARRTAGECPCRPRSLPLSR
jgi:hypothetical protein